MKLKDKISEVEKRLKYESRKLKRHDLRIESRRCHRTVSRKEFVRRLWNGERPHETMPEPDGPVKNFDELLKWIEKGRKANVFSLRTHKPWDQRNVLHTITSNLRKEGLID